MQRIFFVCLGILGLLLSPAVGTAGEPTLEITRDCSNMIPLFDELPVNDCLVTSMTRRQSDDLVIGVTCSKKRICLFSFDHKSSEVKMLDSFEAPWWDQPRVTLGPNGDIYVGARRVYDKQFVFERLRERPHTPGTHRRRGSVPPPHLINEEADGMPIRHYSPEGKLLKEIPLPESLTKDGVGALVVCADGRMLCGLSSPGGRLFTISLQTGEKKDYGEVVRLPKHHHTRRISKTLMLGDDGRIYLCGATANGGGEYGDEEVMGFILALNPLTGELDTLDVKLPAVMGRRRFAAVDAAVKLSDGSFLGGTTDGYLFRFDPEVKTVECFGKPLRQHNICGLAKGADGLVYGVGGEPLGLPRLFAFDPVGRRMYLGIAPSGSPPGGHPKTFGEIGGIVTTSDGTLICGERERRGYLLIYRQEDKQLEWSNTIEGKQFARCTRNRFIDINDNDGTVQLAPTFLISDAMTRSSKIGESLKDDIYAKKVFYLHSRCKEAEILFFGGGGNEKSPMLITVNGHEILHVQDKEKMLTGGWDRQTIPGEYLQQGRNEIVFSGNGYLLVDADASGENSFKSHTKTGPWKAGILGPKDNLTGEYVVRIRVHGYPPRGTITSLVIDVAGIAAEVKEPTVTPLVKVDRIRLVADTTMPPQTSIRFEVRTGSTPDCEPAKWSSWCSAAEIVGKVPLERFVQWRAELAGSDSNTTPLLSKVTLEASGEVSGANRKHIKLTTAPDNAIADSCYKFDYADPHHPRMRHLREKYKLEEVVAAGKTEIEKFALLRHWVRAQWEGWNQNKYNYCPQWDALEILEMAPQNLALGMCTHYAAVFTQCAAALGYHARELIVDHHCLAEVWSDQYGKWILQDPGLLSGHVVAFQYEKAGVPINALEMHQRSLAGSAEDIEIVPEPPVPIDQMHKQMVNLYCRFGIPLRNDHLYRSEPQELEHGQNQYHWDGYLWWTDSLDPRYPEYSLQTRRPEDFYWTLNKTVITLQDTENKGTLSVRLSGPIPNLDKFMTRINSGQWKQTETSFEWKLQAGKNTLQAKAVNTMDIEGPVNLVELEYSVP